MSGDGEGGGVVGEEPLGLAVWVAAETDASHSHLLGDGKPLSGVLECEGGDGGGAGEPIEHRLPHPLRQDPGNKEMENGNACFNVMEDSCSPIFFYWGGGGVRLICLNSHIFNLIVHPILVHLSKPVKT